MSSIKVNTTLRNFNNKILLFWKYFCYCEPFVLTGIIYYDTVRCYSIFIFIQWKKFLYFHLFSLFKMIFCFLKFALCIYYDTVRCYSIFIFIQWKKFLYFHLFSLFKMIFCFLKFALCFNALFSFLKLVIMIFCPCLFISLYYNFRILSEPNLCIFLGGSLYPSLHYAPTIPHRCLFQNWEYRLEFILICYS